MPLLLILFVAAVIEVVALVVVGNAIGVLPTIGVLVLASVVGALLLRREGTKALVAFSEAVQLRRPPHRELADGVLIVAAGVLIVLPGFVSDVLGLLLLLPPVRAVVRNRMARRAERSVGFVPGGFRAGEFGAGGFGARGRGTVVEGEVVAEAPDPTPGSTTRPVIDHPDTR